MYVDIFYLVFSRGVYFCDNLMPLRLYKIMMDEFYILKFNMSSEIGQTTSKLLVLIVGGCKYLQAFSFDQH